MRKYPQEANRCFSSEAAVHHDSISRLTFFLRSFFLRPGTQLGQSARLKYTGKNKMKVEKKWHLCEKHLLAVARPVIGHGRL